MPCLRFRQSQMRVVHLETVVFRWSQMRVVHLVTATPLLAVEQEMYRAGPRASERTGGASGLSNEETLRPAAGHHVAQ